MLAAILSIGDELVLGQTLDTNTAWLAGALGDLDITCVEHRTVRDDRAAIAAAIRELARDADIVLMTGGLGPTADDLTREALNDCTDPGAALIVDPDALAALERFYADRGTMPMSNRRQAMRPSSARLLDNPNGTAPGLLATLESCLVAALPGPPREMHPMFRDHVVPAIEAWATERGAERTPVVVDAIRAVGLGESDAAERLGDLMDRTADPTVGTTASEGILTARLRSRGAGASDRVAATGAQVERAWAPYVFGRGDVTLQEAVGRALAHRARTLATAESCTGGWLGRLLVDVPGSSAWYRGGWVVYANDLKASQLGVPVDLIDRFGAVSAEVACCMAYGAMARADATDGVGITGIAGPGGGTPEKPVGLVWIGLAARTDRGPRVRARCFRFGTDRTAVRSRSAITALQLVRLILEADESWPPARSATPMLREDQVAGRRADRRAVPLVMERLGLEADVAPRDEHAS